MWKQIIVLLILLSSSPAYALDDANFQKLKEKQNTYNANVHKVPGILLRLFGNERINIELTSCPSNCDLGLVTSSGQMTQLNRGQVNNPSMNAEMSESLLINLINSPNPRDVFINAFKSGQIKVSGVGILSKIKLGLLKLLAKLLL